MRGWRSYTYTLHDQVTKTRGWHCQVVPSCLPTFLFLCDPCKAGNFNIHQSSRLEHIPRTSKPNGVSFANGVTAKGWGHTLTIWLFGLLGLLIDLFFITSIKKCHAMIGDDAAESRCKCRTKPRFIPRFVCEVGSCTTERPKTRGWRYRVVFSPLLISTFL